MAKVTVIEPVVQRLMVDRETFKPKKLRVAAYARVSTLQEEQQNSYEAQVDYYTALIKANPEWEFVGVYADEGVTGTNTKKREGFNAMMEAAMNGEIDVILTKSISRFARNTVDALTAVRELKERSIEVRFEKERINTLDPKCEFMLSVMSSFAQDESRSISENVRWGIQRSMQRGKVNLVRSNFLGYRTGADGKPEIDEKEAAVIRRIYDMYLDGKTIRYIADSLTADGIPTPGRTKAWCFSTVKSILTNEKYKGDALLQKTLVVDYLTKKTKKNDGDAKQFYISNSHPAIIEPDKFDLVQTEIERRCRQGSKLSNNSPFTTRIICGDCGGYFGHKVYHGKDKYRVDAWQCNQRYKGEKVCETPTLKEYEIKRAFLDAMERILKQRDAYITLYSAELTQLADTAKLEGLRDKAEERLQDVIQELQDMIQQNARYKQDQTVYQAQYEIIRAKVDEKKKELELAKAKIIAQTAKKEKLRRFIRGLESCDGTAEYSNELFMLMIDHINVKAKQDEKPTLVFTFTDGTEITIKVER